MYLLIPDTATARRSSFRPLHPTMYLLIPVRTCNADDRKNFTSHYVSINSGVLKWKNILIVSLHPTMYLLIPVAVSGLTATFTFTSHYVSINSGLCYVYITDNRTLHPTMYLLIPDSEQCSCICAWYFTSHYVSINSTKLTETVNTKADFTSHYVSINSI